MLNLQQDIQVSQPLREASTHPQGRQSLQVRAVRQIIQSSRYTQDPHEHPHGHWLQLLRAFLPLQSRPEVPHTHSAQGGGAKVSRVSFDLRELSLIESSLRNSQDH